MGSLGVVCVFRGVEGRGLMRLDGPCESLRPTQPLKSWRDETNDRDGGGGTRDNSRHRPRAGTAAWRCVAAEEHGRPEAVHVLHRSMICGLNPWPHSPGAGMCYKRRGRGGPQRSRVDPPLSSSRAYLTASIAFSVPCSSLSQGQCHPVRFPDLLGGGRGLKATVYQEWPKPMFPSVNSSPLPQRHLGRGGGGLPVGVSHSDTCRAWRHSTPKAGGITSVRCGTTTTPTTRCTACARGTVHKVVLVPPPAGMRAHRALRQTCHLRVFYTSFPTVTTHRLPGGAVQMPDPNRVVVAEGPGWGGGGPAGMY